ncbi:MAG: DUF6502 family protein, partial [Planctomycetota bacterium]
GFSRERVRILGNMYSDLGATIVHNLDEQNVDDPRIARYVVADGVSSNVAREFQALTEERGQAVLQELDGWLNAAGRQDLTEKARKGAKRVGLGIYFFEEPMSEQSSSSNPSGDDNDP